MHQENDDACAPDKELVITENTGHFYALWVRPDLLDPRFLCDVHDLSRFSQGLKVIDPKAGLTAAQQGLRTLGKPDLGHS
jgi:hypothetical protein